MTGCSESQRRKGSGRRPGAACTGGPLARSSGAAPVSCVSEADAGRVPARLASATEDKGGPSGHPLAQAAIGPALRRAPFQIPHPRAPRLGPRGAAGVPVPGPCPARPQNSRVLAVALAAGAELSRAARLLPPSEGALARQPPGREARPPWGSPRDPGRRRSAWLPAPTRAYLRPDAQPRRLLQQERPRLHRGVHQEGRRRAKRPRLLPQQAQARLRKGERLPPGASPAPPRPRLTSAAPATPALPPPSMCKVPCSGRCPKSNRQRLRPPRGPAASPPAFLRLPPVTVVNGRLLLVSKLCGTASALSLTSPVRVARD